MEWDDLKKVDDVLYLTYRDACYARGLLQDDKEYIDGIFEASLWGMGDYLRSIFVMLIMTNSMSWLEIVWEKTRMKLAEDVLNVERIKQDLELSDIQRKNICLSYIECMICSNNRSLKDIQNMPYPDQEYGSLTTEQKGIYFTVMDAVENNKGGMFFVYGYGGTGKTYLYKTMSVVLRSKGDIVLNVASSGIAALLLEGGRTAHSRFAIPINVVDDSMCHIVADSDLADLIRKANLIIWDEALQILPVITNGDRQDVVNATINSSYLWGKCIVLRLTVNMQLGNGKVGGANDGESTIVFPDNMLIPETDDDVGAIIDDTYPNFLQNLWNPSFFQEKAILLHPEIFKMSGLCNGTRLQVLRLGINILEAQIISGGSVGTICAIPRMIISPTDTKMPFKLNRRQFPIQVCFAMTINKSQGQTLSQVGLFLRRPVFLHVQLYVVVSRVKSKKGLKVLCSDKDENYSNSTSNVVYKEVLVRI
ncbi:ATP-dependent DNA helicase PIF1-like protein [Tanacetum coccineum]|uniref:ATP-dependent DNA helicase n=1 Tax=Tanacetum coccineum TaxID=301880 RepID=A0ABQ5EJ37_9ASTR